MTAEQILKQYWGYDRFRPLQSEIIQSVVDGNDTLALLPTGGGKSLCYQVPALLTDGFCLVVSPLIALMQDQVGRLQQLGIAAACIHSGMQYKQVKQTLENAMHGAYQLLYVSPERLRTRLFNDYTDGFDLSLIAIDEAHCISQWGHDFRPDYLKIAELRVDFPGVPVLALTASATPEVQADMMKQLELRDAKVFRQSFARNNIQYTIRYSENKNGDTLKNTSSECSIVYCRSRRQTEAISRHLEQAGVQSTYYHAGMSKDRRDEAQELWMADKAPVIAATTAFGMGIDKPDVRMVLHYDAPEHLEAYYQEAGRAGRDGQPSIALALYNSTDIKRLKESTALQYPPEAYLRKVYQSVVEYLQIPIGAQPDKYYPFDLSDFCRKFSLTLVEAMPALKLLEQEGLWTMTESVYNPATIQFTADRYTLDDVGKVHPELGYVIVGLLRMYNTIFHFPTPVRETAIARQLRMKKDELLPLLQRLHQMDILHYNRPSEGPQLFFHHYRVDSRHLLINLNRIHALRKRHEARTEAMIAFLENTTQCRERLLLTYFGEQPKHDCGHCDICANKATTKGSDKDLRTELVNNIKSATTIAVHDLVASYPTAIKQQAIALIREMIDEGVIDFRESVVFLVKNV